MTDSIATQIFFVNDGLGDEPPHAMKTSSQSKAQIQTHQLRVKGQVVKSAMKIFAPVHGWEFDSWRQSGEEGRIEDDGDSADEPTLEPASGPQSPGEYML